MIQSRTVQQRPTTHLLDVDTAFNPAAHPVVLMGARFEARPSGALWWPARAALVISDLMLGLERGASLSLRRLEYEIDALRPRRVLCVGRCLGGRPNAGQMEALQTLTSQRIWTWIPCADEMEDVSRLLGGQARMELRLAAERGHLDARRMVTFRSLASDENEGAEISGGYAPNIAMRGEHGLTMRKCFLADSKRAILPSFGVGDGGTDVADELFNQFLEEDAAVLTVGAPVRAKPRSVFLSRPYRG